jgi:flagellar motility protein MotE (MotC chaperone)
LKGKIIYIGAFVLAFLLVTGGIYYLNTKFANIFAFDFSPAAVKTEKTTGKKDSGNKKDAKPENKKEAKKEEPKKEEPKKEEQAPQPVPEQQEELAITPTFVPPAASKSNLKPLTAAEQKKENDVKQAGNKALLDSINNLNKKLKELLAAKDDKKIQSKVKETVVNADSIKRKEMELADIAERKDSTYKTWLKKTVTLYEAMDSRKAAKIILTYSDNIAKDIVYSMKKKKAAEILGQFSPEIVNRITRVK